MDLLQEFASVSIYQKLAFLFSMVYIVFAIYNKPVCFVFGLLSAIFWAWESFFILNLKFDAALQVFYILMSLWGLIVWFKEDENRAGEENIKEMGVKAHLIFLGTGIALTGILYWFVAPLLDTQLALLDAGTTVFSMLATYLLVKRYIENWLYFVVLDLIYIWIYSQAGGHLFAIIMAIFIVMAIWGYLQWRKLKSPSLI